MEKLDDWRHVKILLSVFGPHQVGTWSQTHLQTLDGCWLWHSSHADSAQVECSDDVVLPVVDMMLGYSIVV